MVCDSEQSCFVARSLYLAEEHLEEIEHGYSFHYSTSFQKPGLTDLQACVG